MLRRCASLVSLLALLPAAPALADVGFCRTMEDYLAHNPPGDPLSGECATQGTCDVPAVRDAYLADEDTPIRWLRIHLVVFRLDNGTNPAATEQEIIDQMITMNEDYLPYRIQFTYTWEYVDDTRYRNGSGDGTMKSLYARDPDTQCNIFITNLSGGVGTFPWDSRALTSQGGIILGRVYFSAIHHVITHEMGHNLGLWHTHHGVNEVPQCSACYESPNDPDRNVNGDFCADTPPRPSNFGQCAPPGGNDPCSGAPWGDTQPENYMSYGSGDGIGCWTLFTTQQTGRIFCWSNEVLLGWLDCDAGNDCNDNGTNDSCDIRDGFSLDEDGDGIPDECGKSIPGDVDGDGDVDMVDLLRLLSAWGACEGACPEDLDDDEQVGFSDLQILLSNWT